MDGYNVIRTSDDDGESFFENGSRAIPRIIQMVTHENEKFGNSSTSKLYKIRWFILYLYCISTGSSLMQWPQYAVIGNVIVDYYGVSYEAVDWTAMVYLLLYLPCIVPGMYLMDKMGLRVAILLAMLGTTAGAWIKVGSVSPERFWVLILGQSLVACSQVFLLSFPAPLASVWFGPNEVFTACSIGVFGTQLGMAAGFIIPPMIVKDDGDTEYQLYIMSIGVAIVTTIMFILLLVFFKDKPPTPPVPAQLQNEMEPINGKTFLHLLKKLMINPPYVMFIVSYGINIGIFYAISTLLNQIVLNQYPEATEDVGRIGLVLIVAGMFGSIITGLILDKFGHFKITTVTVYVSCLVIMVVFTFTISNGIAIVYVVSAVYGFFTTGLMAFGLEIATEITYPDPEGTTTGLAMTSCQLFGIIFNYLYAYLFYNVDEFWANISMCVALFFSTVLVVLMPFRLQRQLARKNLSVIDK